ncbi:crinkler family protein [Gigaspora margarita]|uniref:Crinkler family protein n=1 Tax=Gigaspora margarita TaxID=4874 RepID=A0A8H3XII7_GIGMA|nr:crinkler family protein [Gigaspora margarita]
MDVTCLIEGDDPLDDVFLVSINKNELVSKLKNAIRVANPQTFVDVADKDLKLWKVDITLDKSNEMLEILESKERAVIKERLNGMKLVAFKKINEYFSEVPEENHLSIIIERPPVIKSTSSLEVNQVFSIKVSHGKYRQSFQWIVDLSRASLNDIKRKVLHYLPLLQDMKADTLKLHFSRENDKELEFKNDEDFQEYLKCCVMTSSLSLKVQVYTLQKAFSEWRFGTVCDLFELPPDFREFSNFSCGIDILEDSKAEELLKHLYKDLKLRLKAIHGKLEATKSKFVEPFLVIATSLFDGKVKLYPEHDVQGTYGRGPLDFCLYLKGIIVGVVEVKKDDFDQGVAQTAMQLHCSLEKNRKRKRNEMEEIEDLFIDKAYGIITDSSRWYFIECVVNEDDKPKFSIHSKDGTLIDWSEEIEPLEKGTRRVLGHIIWLLKEAEKLIESKLSEKKRKTG